MTVTQQWMDRTAIGAVIGELAPVASAYLGPGPGVAHEYELAWSSRWRPVAEQLRSNGADGPTVRVLEDAASAVAGVRAAHGRSEVAVFAANGRLLATVPARGAGWPDDGRVSSPAHLLPLLEWQQGSPPYVVVVADRAGADIETHPGGGRPAQRTSVEGPDDDIARTTPAGLLGQGRLERRTEDSWKHNAGAVARHAVSALDRVDGRVLVLSGDARAVQLLTEQLPERVTRSVVVEQIRGGRGADGSQRHRRDTVAAALQVAVQRETAGLLDRFSEELAPRGLAVEGEDGTLAALAQGRVATLLVAHTLVDDPRVAWFGSGPTEVRPGTRPRPGWADPQRGPLLDVAVRSALLAGADVRVVPVTAAVAEGLGGLCRFREI